MRKDNVLGVCEIDDNGQFIKFETDNINNPELPLAHRCNPKYIQKWWNDRCVPLSRDNVNKVLNGENNRKYLLNNLAISLTDYYWIKPIDSNYTWNNINAFTNDFINVKTFNPNSSLQGDLEKTWLIVDGVRVLVKGNHNSLSQESINEVIASKFHELQGYKNYVKYELLKIKNTDYEYGCCCNAFTSNDIEFVSAYDLLTSQPKPNNISDYEQLIRLAHKCGIDSKKLRNDLEYQILSDYILSNKDRHMNNIGFLRDANTLKFISMAPIFDTGNSMFNDTYIPNNLDKLEINSFVKKESKILDYITNKDLIDFDVLPSVDYIKEMYSKDPNMERKNIDDICDAYVRKISLLKNKLKH